MLLIVLFSSVSAFAFAEEEIKEDKDSPVKVRQVNEKVFEKYEKDEEFNYMRELVQAPVSLWDKFWNWVNYWISKLFRTSFETPEVRFVFVVAVIILVVILLLKAEIGKLFFKNRQRESINAVAEIEDIRKIKIDDIITQAIEDRNYRKAVRYLYLKLLKELDKKDFISWTINKTNREYALELKRELKPDFKKLSRFYEYVWYGDFEVNKNGFEAIHEHYKNYFSKI